MMVRLAGAHTNGWFSLVEHAARRGYNAPLHVHARDDESSLVIEGSLRVVCDGKEHVAERGAVVLLPHGSRHTFVVTSADARFYTLHHPAGFENFVIEAGTPAPELVPPPPLSGPPPPDVLEALTSTASRYGISIVGPPPEL